MLCCKLCQRRGETMHALDETRAVLGLSQNELADLVGIRQPSLSERRSRGVPAAGRASVERLRDLAFVLKRKVIPTRISEIVRTRDEMARQSHDARGNARRRRRSDLRLPRTFIREYRRMSDLPETSRGGDYYHVCDPGGKFARTQHYANKRRDNLIFVGQLLRSFATS